MAAVIFLEPGIPMLQFPRILMLQKGPNVLSTWQDILESHDCDAVAISCLMFVSIEVIDLL